MESLNVITLVVLSAVFCASIGHIYEAYKKRDAAALGEGAGTLAFSLVGILLKLISIFP
jgi:hypothetical protein